MFLSVDILFLYLLIISCSPDIYAHKRTPPQQPITHNRQPYFYYFYLLIFYFILNHPT